MPKIHDGGPAFPRPSFAPHDVGYEDVGICGEQDGMTLRDWFAGQALAGLLASFTGDVALPDSDRATRAAYAYADAMITRRAVPAAA